MVIHRRNLQYGLSVVLLLVFLSAVVFRNTASAHDQLPLLSPSNQETLSAACANPANSTVAENCLPGTAGWLDIETTPSIEIFVGDDSVNIGRRLDFYVSSQSPMFDLKIYRIGYYGGIGARLVHEKPNLSASPQPECIRVEDVGLRSCSNWRSSYTLTIPADWVSGVYAVQVLQPGTNIGNETVFTVRQDDRKSDVLYQMSTNTFQAYNNYDGKSVYSSNSGTCDTVANAPRAVKVSLHRPYNATMQDPNYFYRAEYPMVRWLEQQGYDITYSTNMDTHRSGKVGSPNRLLDHKAFLSVGHDEYWSEEMRNAITAARDAGVHIGFFTANTGYWRVRFEPDPVTNEPDSVMVTYKTTESGSPDPSGVPTGTWRDPQGANNPENGLIGVMYIGDNYNLFFPLRLSSEYTSDPLFRHTGLQDMPANSYLDVGEGIVGWEWDRTADNGMSPDGLTVVADTPLYGFILQDAGRAQNGNLSPANAVTTYYVAPSGAIVFASGTIQWSWGLGAHGVEIQPTDPYIAQITYNILADMQILPATPVDIIVDGSDVPDLPLPTDRVKTLGEVQPPNISDIQITADDTSFTVTWKTDDEATGQLWYGTSPDHIISALPTDSTRSFDHSFTATGLVAERTYYIKVASINGDWTYTISDGSSITTSAASVPQKFKAAFDPLLQRGKCWISANRTGAIIMGVLGVVIVALLVAPTFILRRRLKARALRARQ